MRGVQEGAVGARAPQRCTSQKRLVLRYINAVTSAMRTSPRWSQAAGATERRPELGHHEYYGAESYARSADARSV